MDSARSHHNEEAFAFAKANAAKHDSTNASRRRLYPAPVQPAVGSQDQHRVPPSEDDSIFVPSSFLAQRRPSQALSVLGRLSARCRASEGVTGIQTETSVLKRPYGCRLAPFVPQRDHDGHDK